MNSTAGSMRRLFNVTKLAVPMALLLVLAFMFGWRLAPDRPSPRIVIEHIGVEPLRGERGTILRITTGYKNSGCDQILLARFLLNTKPTPSIALPQRQGPVILPASGNMIVENVPLGFPLRGGQWHMFSVVSCYVDGSVIPDATVSPTALFEIT